MDKGIKPKTLLCPKCRKRYQGLLTDQQVLALFDSVVKARHAKDAADLKAENQRLRETLHDIIDLDTGVSDGREFMGSCARAAREALKDGEE